MPDARPDLDADELCACRRSIEAVYKRYPRDVDVDVVLGLAVMALTEIYGRPEEAVRRAEPPPVLRTDGR